MSHSVIGTYDSSLVLSVVSDAVPETTSSEAFFDFTNVLWMETTWKCQSSAYEDWKLAGPLKRDNRPDKKPQILIKGFSVSEFSLSDAPTFLRPLNDMQGKWRTPFPSIKLHGENLIPVYRDQFKLTIYWWYTMGVGTYDNCWILCLAGKTWEA